MSESQTVDCTLPSPNERRKRKIVIASSNFFHVSGCRLSGDDWQAMPRGIPPLIAGMVCYFGSTLVATPFFALAAWFHSRFVSPRPALAGGLYGAGAALTANAGWRLICPISTPWHVLTAHGGSMISITLLSALIAHLVAVRR